MTLLELAGRCEKATGPDFALEHDIVAALDIEHQNRWAMAENAGVEPNPFPLPRYTTSLDAAMTLVPEGVQWSVEHYPGCNHPSGKSCATVRTPLDRVVGHTPALALCAAALRARGETL